MSSRWSLRMLTLGCLMAWPVAVLRGQAGQDTTRLQELVVTATRLPTAPDEVVSSITTITGEELQARTLDGTWDRRLRSGDVDPDIMLDVHGRRLDGAWAAEQREPWPLGPMTRRPRYAIVAEA